MQPLPSAAPHPASIHNYTEIKEMTAPEPQGAAYEEQHVHAVYEEIASHFSATRYKVCAMRSTPAHMTNSSQPWPIIERFLKELPDGAVGADVGCGNGKYLAVNPRVFMVASDRYGNPHSASPIHAP